MQRYLGRFEGGALLLLRVVLAFLYWSHGVRWLFNWFGGSPVPLNTMLTTAGVIETTCGILIAIGLLTSWAAFIASGEMAVAYFMAHVSRGGWIPIQNMGEITVALCFGFLYLAVRGAGPYSVDALMRSEKRK